MPARQRGIALLILLAIISMAIIFALVAGLNKNAGELARARDQKTYAALAQAKAALIAYAVTYGDDPSHADRVPGFLPCPDLGTSTYEGQAALSCPLSGPSSLVSVIGRLPWRTLGLDALKDGSGECLWYAVSGTYKNNPNGVSTNTSTSNMMNWDTNGQFKVVDSNGNTLAGSSPDNQAVAVIFAPGAALSGQSRTPAAGTPNCGGNYIASSYLESAKDGNNIVRNNSTLVSPSSPPNVADTSTFIAGTTSDTFNDKLVYITRADIWNAIKKRSDFNNYLRAMTRRAAECVAKYGTENSGGTSDQRLPWATQISLSGTSVPQYAVDTSYNDVDNLLTGRLPYKVNTAQSETNNKLPSFDSNDYLFSSNSYCSYGAEQQVWYDNWKDHLFYAVDVLYMPTASPSWPTSYPSFSFFISGSSNHYAAVVIFAGERLSGQSRSTAADKGTISNYLEGSNATNISANGYVGTYQASGASPFNDVVYAIDANLAVQCLSASSGTMRTVPGTTVAPPGSAADVKNYAACP